MGGWTDQQDTAGDDASDEDLALEEAEALRLQVSTPMHARTMLWVCACVFVHVYVCICDKDLYALVLTCRGVGVSVVVVVVIVAAARKTGHRRRCRFRR